MDLKHIGFSDKNIDNGYRRAYIESVHGSIYTLDGYNLLTKVDFDGLTMQQENDRVVILNNDNSIVMDANVHDIHDWKAKKLTDNIEEHFFSIKNKGVYFQMLIEGYVECV